MIKVQQGFYQKKVLQGFYQQGSFSFDYLNGPQLENFKDYKQTRDPEFFLTDFIDKEEDYGQQ